MKKFTLDSIVRDYLIEVGAESASDKRYPRYLQLAINGLREIAQAKQSYPKKITVDISDNGIIYLPDDYIDYRQIAICVGGRLFGLGLNKNICDPANNDCGELNAPTINSHVSNYDNVFYGVTSSTNPKSPNEFGLGGGKNGIGYYNVFEDRGYIAISLTGYSFSWNTTSVILDYEADIQKDSFSGEFQVMPYDVEPLKAYIYWANMRRLRSYSMGEKDAARRDFERILHNSRKKEMKFNIRELVSALAESTFTGV